MEFTDAASVKPEDPTLALQAAFLLIRLGYFTKRTQTIGLKRILNRKSGIYEMAEADSISSVDGCHFGHGLGD